MNQLLVAAIGCALLALHVAVGALLGPGASEWLPDPLVWLACIPVCFGTAAEALTVAWMLGCARDLVLPDPLGLHSLAFACAAWPAWHARRGFDVRQPSARAIAAGLLAAAYALGLAAGRAATGDAALGEALRRTVLPVAVTAALAPGALRALLALPVLRAWERRTRFLGTA
jgi:rod shape-determining protein MreD